MKRIFLTGASGYVVGRLLSRLEERKFHVRCLARKPEFLARRVSAHTEVVEGDVLYEESLGRARGRPDSEELCVGDSVDWWRVESFEPGRLLRMRAEMKLPGRAWIEFEVRTTGKGSTIRQTAIFDPSGCGTSCCESACAVPDEY